MSTPQRPFSPLEVREQAVCMCTHGETCTSYAPGHSLHLLQARLASGSPSQWQDAIVELADASTGVIHLRLLENDALVVVWNFAGAAEALVAGSPVAAHQQHGVLAAGPSWFNVAKAS